MAQTIKGFDTVNVLLEGGGATSLSLGDELPSNAAKGEADRLSALGAFNDPARTLATDPVNMPQAAVVLPNVATGAETSLSAPLEEVLSTSISEGFGAKPTKADQKAAADAVKTADQSQAQPQP